MKTLVTGGAGFIGSNIVRLLIEEGHDVSVLDNLSSGYCCNIDMFPNVHFIEGDVRNAEMVSRAVSGIEVVFHLAASVGNKRSIEHPIDDSEINVIGTLRVLEAARLAGVRKIVFSSSASIFGELRTLPIREDHPLEPDSPYGASKLAGEKLALTYAKIYNLEVVCLRYFNVYGVNQRYDAYGNAIPIIAYRMLNDLVVVIFDDGEQTRDFVNVRDVALANYKASLTTGISGAYNIASGSRVTINNLVKQMSEVSGIKPSIEYGPHRNGDVRHSLADVSAAKQAFGYQASVGLKEGLGEYMKWAMEERCANNE
jgi:UDP-glucose 4-epimerase